MPKMVKRRLRHGKFTKRNEQRQREVFRKGDIIEVSPAQAEVYRDMLEVVTEVEVPVEEEAAEEVAPPAPATKPATAPAAKPAAKPAGTTKAS